MASVVASVVEVQARLGAPGLVLVFGLALAGNALPVIAAPDDGTGAPTPAQRNLPDRSARSNDRIRRWDRVPPTSADTVAPPPAAAPSGMRYVVESGAVSFGDVVPDQDRVVTGAILVRVFSDRDWRLQLNPGEPLRSLDRGRVVPLSRLTWRAQGAGADTPFREGAPVVVGAGPRTSGAGALVAVDLRLLIADEDPLGAYATSFRLELAPN